MSNSIIDLSQTPLESLTTEICVIGSGSGGATAARVLAEAGHEVVVLEEGGDFTGAQLTQRDGAMYDQLYMDRGGRMTEDLSISVLQGRVLGGGGVINMSDVVPIAPPIFDHWAKEFGLSDFTPAALLPYEKLALEDLFANPIQDEQINRANALLKQAAEAKGYRGEAMHHNRVGCMGLGTCLIGCPVNAKRNPRFVAIPKAMAAGAKCVIRARAVRIDDLGGDIKRISIRGLDAKGYHEVSRAEIRAKIVILAANAVGSAQLLLRSGVDNPQVGQHLSLQPQLPITAIFPEPIIAFRGIPQSYAMTEFETCDEDRGLGGFRIEPVMGTPGIVASILPFSGADAKQAMTLYPRLAASLLLPADQTSGRIRVSESGRPIIAYDHLAEHKARLRQAARVAAELYLDAGAKEVVVPANRPITIRTRKDIDAIDALPLAPATVPLLSAHQQGGVRFAGSAKDGGADPSGQVFGTKHVYVFDSSGFPSSSSSHTMAPIITVSRYLADRLAQTLG